MNCNECVVRIVARWPVSSIQRTVGLTLTILAAHNQVSDDLAVERILTSSNAGAFARARVDEEVGALALGLRRFHVCYLISYLLQSLTAVIHVFFVTHALAGGYDCWMVSIDIKRWQ